MPACPARSHSAPREASRCPACNAYLGCARDLANLAVFLGALLALVGIILVNEVIGPNLKASRAIAGVRHDQPDDVDAIRQLTERGEIATPGSEMGWSSEQFDDLFLVSFTYTNPQEKNPRRYASWWAYDAATRKSSKIQKAEEFLDGYLLRNGLKRLFPDGIGRGSSSSTGKEPGRG